MNINKTDLKYLFRDFTDIGKPTNTKISFVTDDQVYKWNPDRYNFYMQILDEVMNPDSKVIDTVLSIENRTRRSREKIMENVQNIANTIGYLDARQRFIEKKQSGGDPEDEKKIKELEKLISNLNDKKDLLTDISEVFNSTTNNFNTTLTAEFNKLKSVISNPFFKNKNKFEAFKNKLKNPNAKLDSEETNFKPIYDKYINNITTISKLFTENTYFEDTLKKRIKDFIIIKPKNSNKLHPNDYLINNFKNIIDGNNINYTIIDYILNFNFEIAKNNLKTVITSKEAEIKSKQEKIENEKLEQKKLEEDALRNNDLGDTSKTVEQRVAGFFTNKLAGTGSIASRWVLESVAKPVHGGGASSQILFKDVASELDKNASSYNDIKKTLLMYENDPVISPKVNQLNYMDKVIFIAFTFLIRAITLFIIQWGLNTRMLTDFTDAFVFYIFIYMALFILWCFLVNATTDNIFFKIMFYYVNLDSGSGQYARMKAWGRIIAHFVIFLLLIPVPFIVKDTVNANLYSTDQADQTVYEKRIKTYRYISQFTFFIWILTSVIAFSTP